eukprot:1671911-Heterocapsa_arctica.AAC.1
MQGRPAERGQPGSCAPPAAAAPACHDQAKEPRRLAKEPRKPACGPPSSPRPGSGRVARC